MSMGFTKSPLTSTGGRKGKRREMSSSMGCTKDLVWGKEGEGVSLWLYVNWMYQIPTDFHE